MTTDSNLDPSQGYQTYETPGQIIKDERLSRNDKIDLLEAWATDAKALSRASGEGLNGGEQNQLKSVLDALSSLKANQ